MGLLLSLGLLLLRARLVSDRCSFLAVPRRAVPLLRWDTPFHRPTHAHTLPRALQNVFLTSQHPPSHSLVTSISSMCIRPYMHVFSIHLSTPHFFSRVPFAPLCFPFFPLCTGACRVCSALFSFLPSHISPPVTTDRTCLLPSAHIAFDAPRTIISLPSLDNDDDNDN